MAEIPISATGVLYDLYNRTTQRVVFIGEASIAGLGVGGGPMPGGPGLGFWGGSPVPHPGHDLPGQPPGIWGGAPIGPNPPGVWPGPGQPPGIWGGAPIGPNPPHPDHGLPEPPTEPPVDPEVPPGDLVVKAPPQGQPGWGYVSTWGWGYFPGGTAAGPKR
jgi:hypothetical protein